MIAVLCAEVALIIRSFPWLTDDQIYVRFLESGQREIADRTQEVIKEILKKILEQNTEKKSTGQDVLICETRLALF